MKTKKERKGLLLTMAIRNFECFFCKKGIYTCDACGEFFQRGEDIYCDKKGKHYCIECGSLI